MDAAGSQSRMSCRSPRPGQAGGSHLALTTQHPQANKRNRGNTLSDKLSRALLCAASLFATAAATPALAASTAPPAAQPDGTTLETVVVTARRRDETLQRVPAAITALSSADLQKLNLQNTQDLTRTDPSLIISGQQRNDAQFYMRGQGPGIISPGVNNFTSVQTYFLDVPTQVSGPGIFYDLQNVQILKGPQGTLFGRNTTGGAVLFTPAKPTGDYEGYLQGRLGNYNDRELEGAVNIPVIPDILNVRVSGALARRQGFTKNVITGQDLDDRNYDAWRISVDFKPNDRFENYFVFDGRNINQHGGSAILLEANAKASLGTAPVGPPGGIPVTFGGAGPNPYCLAGVPVPSCPAGGPAAALAAGVAAHDFAAYPDPLLQNVLARQRALGPRREASDLVGLDFERAYGFTDITTIAATPTTTIKNILGLRSNRSDLTADFAGTVLPILRELNTAHDYGLNAIVQVSDELQVQGRNFDGRFNWLAGLYLEHATPGQPLVSLSQQFAPAGLTPAQIAPRDVIERHSYSDYSEAGFLHGEYAFPGALEGWKLSAGVRYTWDQREAQVSVYNAKGVCTQTVNMGAGPQPECPIDEHGSFQAPTFDVNLSYQVSPDILTYATVRRGYKSGGFNLPAPTDPAGNPEFVTFGPETVLDAEFGVKADYRLAGMKFRTNIAVFHDNYDNIQVSEPTAIGGQITSVVRNAASAVIEGVELEFTAIPIRNLQLSAFYSYLSATNSSDFIEEGVNERGRQLAYQPMAKFGFSGSYDLPLSGNLGDLVLSADYSFQEHMLTGDPLDPIAFYPAYGVANARLDWNNLASKPIDLSLFVTNLADNTYQIGGFPIYGEAGINSAIYGEPRMYGIQLRVRWGPNARW